MKPHSFGIALSAGAVGLLALAAPARAGWTEQGTMVDTVMSVHTYGGPATIARRPDGSFLAYFTRSRYSGIGHLSYADALTPPGVPLYEGLDGATGSATGAAVSWDGTSALFKIPAPASFFGDGAGGPGATVLQHLTAAGVQDWGAASGVLLAPGGSSAFVNGHDVLADGAGGAWAAWTAPGGLTLRHFAAGGVVAPSWPAGDVVFAGGGMPALANDGAGGVVLFFLDAANAARAIRIQADGAVAPGWPAAGLALGAVPFRDADLQMKPVLVPAGGGHMVALWMGADPASATGSRFGLDGALDPGYAGGGTLSLPTGFGTWNTVTCFLPATLADGGGGFHHVYADPASGQPRWVHVLASGAFAVGGPAGGVSPLGADGTVQAIAGMVPAASNTGGLVFAWDDAALARIRVRWFMPDGSDDPGAPAAGRDIPGTDAGSTAIGLSPDAAGNVVVLWGERAGTFAFRTFASFMSRTPAALGVAPGVPAALALATPWPNPARGPLDVRCALPDGRAARLVLYDVGGRALRAQDVQGAGGHVVRLERAGSLPPGLYLLRLSQGAVARTTRIAVVR